MLKWQYNLTLQVYSRWWALYPTKTHGIRLVMVFINLCGCTHLLKQCILSNKYSYSYSMVHCPHLNTLLRSVIRWLLWLWLLWHITARVGSIYLPDKHDSLPTMLADAGPTLSHHWLCRSCWLDCVRGGVFRPLPHSYNWAAPLRP